MTDGKFLNHFVLVLGVLVGVTAIILVIAISLSSIHYEPDMAMIDSMEKRITPVGKVYVGDVSATTGSDKKEVGTAEGTTKDVPALAKSGKEVYNSACAVCHTTGIAGSPVFGNKSMWAPRVATGIETLYNAALNGKGAMPAKGGHPNLSNEEIKHAVDYMLNAIQ